MTSQKMLLYVVLIRFTQKGIEQVKYSADRANDTYERIARYGGRVKGLYLTLGQYDVVHLFEVPDEESMMKFMLESRSLGNCDMVAMRAYDEPDYRRICDSLKEVPVR
jgi:uncharacterized protein with GYD domain